MAGNAVNFNGDFSSEFFKKFRAAPYAAEEAEAAFDRQVEKFKHALRLLEDQKNQRRLVVLSKLRQWLEDAAEADQEERKILESLIKKLLDSPQAEKQEDVSPERLEFAGSVLNSRMMKELRHRRVWEKAIRL